MRNTSVNGLKRTLQWSAFGSVCAGLITFGAFRLHLSFATTAFLFLLLLLGQSLSGNFVSAAVVSLLGVACLDYYFLDPLFSFDVNSSLDTLGLAGFLITGLAMTNLVIRLRNQTALSKLHHERLQRLYRLAQQLLVLEPDPAGVSEFLNLFLGTFSIQAVCLFDAASADVHIVGHGYESIEKKTGEAFIHGDDVESPGEGISARCIRVGGRVIGAIGFAGLEDPELTGGPLAALAAAHLEKTHSFVHASRSAAAAQTESYRSAILDALAHEFKTPLSTILTAAGALREAPSLSPQHRELAETVESEASRLGRLTSRLIRTARLEREEVKPWIELIDVSAVLADTVDQYARLPANRNISIVKECDSSDVLADPELVRLAVSQLLDNACKYSIPGSTVLLRVSREHDRIAIRVRTNGNPIPSGETGKIFDRFYRGIDGRRTGPGSGLGLFVARKIALALGGDLELESQPEPVDGTVFRLSLPVPESDWDA